MPYVTRHAEDFPSELADKNHAILFLSIYIYISRTFSGSVPSSNLKTVNDMVAVLAFFGKIIIRFLIVHC